MESDVLQKFLDRGLLNLGEATDKFTYVTSAALDLASSLKQDRKKLIRASSMLVGNTLAAGEPLVEECEEVIKKHWPTYRGRFPSDTTQLFRATILQGITNITRDESDTDCAAIVFYTTCGLIPLMTVAGEDGIFREFVGDLGKQIEAKAVNIWGSPKDVAVPAVQYSEVTAVPASIDAKSLKEALKAALSNTGTNPNPHGVGSAEWADHFAQHAANSISSGIAAVLKDTVTKLTTQSRADNRVLSGAIDSTLNGLASDRHSSEVLYWKESLFSLGRSTSYRAMSADAALYWAASDLQSMVPRYHPISLEYFLRETVRAAIGKDEALKGITCANFCRELARSPESVSRAYTSLPAQRLTLLEAAQAVATKEIDAKVAVMQTGIPPEARIPREEIAVWLLRDSQALRLAGGH